MFCRVPMRGPITRKSEPREADEHHCPGRGLWNRSANDEVEPIAARSVSGESVRERQIDVGPVR